MYKLFIDSNHADNLKRSELFPLLKPYYKNAPLSFDECMKAYGFSINQFDFENEIAACDFVVLPMSWNYYYRNNKIQVANSYIQNAKKNNKKVVSWTSGDWGITPPYDKDVFVYRYSGYKNKFPANHIIMGANIADPIAAYFNDDEEYVLNKKKY